MLAGGAERGPTRPQPTTAIVRRGEDEWGAQRQDPPAITNGWAMSSRKANRLLIKRALVEDAAGRDITSRAVLPPEARIRAAIIAKQRGVAAGVKMAALTFTTLDPSLRCALKRRDGAALANGQTILTVEGRARSIFAAERTAVNFLGHLSGIATLTRRYVERVRGTRAKIFDTRKTLPGLRHLEKCAVASGGGVNHRSDLADAILIKTNHLRACRQPIAKMIARAKHAAKGKFLEIEVRNLRELDAALAERPDAILLDNWPVGRLREAVRLRGRRRHIHLEVSGSVTLANVRAIARTGVDRISIGRLTHSAPSLDVSLRVL